MMDDDESIGKLIGQYAETDLVEIADAFQNKKGKLLIDRIKLCRNVDFATLPRLKLYRSNPIRFTFYLSQEKPDGFVKDYLLAYIWCNLADGGVATQ